MSRDTQRIIDSPEYESLFPETKLAGYMESKGRKRTEIRRADNFEIVDHEGSYRAVGVGGGITGMGADYAILDDVIKNQEEAESKVYREKVFHWYQSTLYSRLEKDDHVLLTLTRWHEDDLAGRLLNLMQSDPDADQWTIVNFPAVKDTDDNLKDKRQIGEALWPYKYDKERLSKIKAVIGSRYWNSLYQQRPAPQEGGIIKRAWFRFYKELPAYPDEMIQSWDLAVKDKETSDYVAGQVWMRKGAQIFLVDRVKEHADFPTQIQLIRQVSAKHPKAFLKVIEEFAGGTGVIAMLEKEIYGLVPYRPDRDKVTRLNAVAPMFEAGNVFLPDPSIAPWVGDFIEELCSFPNAPHDDEVDACSQALNRFSTYSNRLEDLLQM